MKTTYKEEKDVEKIFPNILKEPVITIQNKEEVLKRLYERGMPEDDLSFFHNIIDFDEFETAKKNKNEGEFDHDIFIKMIYENKQNILDRYFKGDASYFKAADYQHDTLGIIGERENFTEYEKARDGTLYFFIRFITVNTEDQFAELVTSCSIQPNTKVHMRLMLSYLAYEAWVHLKEEAMQGRPFSMDVESAYIGYDWLDLVKVPTPPTRLSADTIEEYTKEDAAEKASDLFTWYSESVLEKQAPHILKKFENSFGEMPYHFSQEDEDGNQHDINYIIDTMNKRAVFMSEGITYKEINKS